MTILPPPLAHPVPHRELAKEARAAGLDAGKTGPDGTETARSTTSAAISHTRAKPPAPPSRTDDLVREVMRRTRRPLYEAEYNPCPMVGPDWWGRK